jgi:hypothetical protein
MLHSALMFVGMVLLQVFVMPFVMAASPTHVYFTLTQLYMGLFMGAAMVAIDGILHPLPVWAWVAVGIIGLGAVIAYRLQIGITDRGWIREMIPHHSMALLTSAKRAQSQDPLVQRLAEKILLTQKEEIGEMEGILAQRRPF